MSEKTILKPTNEESLTHYRDGIGDDCLVCRKKLEGTWTDYNGQIRCQNCGMTYQILGSHLSESYRRERSD